MGLLAAAVSWSIAGRSRGVHIAAVIEQITHSDRLARQHARRFGQTVRIEFDSNHHTVGRILNTREGGQTRQVYRLPAGFTLGKLILAGEASESVVCSPQGYTPTYAVLLSDRQGEKRWLLFVGMTGQRIDFNDEREIDEIFKRLKPIRSQSS